MNQYSRKANETQAEFEQRIAALKAAAASKRAKQGKKAAAPKKAAPKLNKKAAKKAEKIAKAKTGETVTLGPTRQVIVDGLKAGKKLVATYKGGASPKTLRRVELGTEKVRNVALLQLVDLGIVAAKGEVVEGEKGINTLEFALAQ